MHKKVFAGYIKETNGLHVARGPDVGQDLSDGKIYKLLHFLRDKVDGEKSSLKEL